MGITEAGHDADPTLPALKAQPNPTDTTVADQYTARACLQDHDGTLVCSVQSKTVWPLSDEPSVTAASFPIRIAALRFPADHAAQYAHVFARVGFGAWGLIYLLVGVPPFVSPVTPSSHQTRCEPGRTEQIRLSLSHTSTDRF